MSSHWAKKYLGKNWTEQYDCFSFFCEAQTETFGVKGLYDLKNVPDVHSKQLAMDFVKKTVEVRAHWMPIFIPSDGDAALFGQESSFHIGIFTVMDGQQGVVHCQQRQGVIFTSLSAFTRSGAKIAKFMRYRHG